LFVLDTTSIDKKTMKWSSKYVGLWGRQYIHTCRPASCSGYCRIRA